MTEQNNNQQPEWNEPTPRTRKKGKGPIIALVALLIVAAIGIGAYASGIFGGKGSEKDQVAEALSSVLKGEENPFMEDWLGTTKLSENMMKASKMSGRLELVEMPVVTAMTGFPVPGGITLSFETNQDIKAKASSGSMGLGLMGTNIVNGKLYMKDTVLQVAAPSLFEEVLTADLSGDLEAKLNNAPLFKDQLDNDEAADAIRQMSEALKDSGEQQEKLMKLMTGQTKLSDYPGFSKHFKTLKEKWVIEEVDEKTQVWNGKEDSFKGYHVTMPKDAFIEYFRNMKTYFMTDEKVQADILDMVLGQVAAQEEITREEAKKELDEKLSEEIENLETNPNIKDMVFVIHMTNDNEMVSFATDYTTPKAAMKLNFERFGGAYPDENMKLNVSVSGEESGSMEMISTGKTEENSQVRDIVISVKEADQAAMEQKIALTVNKETGLFTVKIDGTVLEEDQPNQMQMTINGKLQDIVKGKSGQMVMDEMKLMMAGEPMMTLKGDLSYDTENITVSELEGEKLDIMTATPEDMETVMEQIQEKLGLLLQLIDFPLGA